MEFTSKRKPEDQISRDKSSKSSKSKREGGIRWKEKSRKVEKTDAEDKSTPSAARQHDREKPAKKPRYSPPPSNSDAPPEPAPEEAQEDGGLDVASKFGAAAANQIRSKLGTDQSDSAAPVSSEVTTDKRKTDKKKMKEGKDRRAPARVNEPMMEVVVNDRLGSKSRIACLGSDKVGDFKKLVAMQIGRKPHEIMLKRQSERPFKDFLTLEDYGVSNGVQLDLELDTGD